MMGARMKMKLASDVKSKKGIILEWSQCNSQWNI